MTLKICSYGVVIEVFNKGCNDFINYLATLAHGRVSRFLKLREVFWGRIQDLFGRILSVHGRVSKFLKIREIFLGRIYDF